MKRRRYTKEDFTWVSWTAADIRNLEQEIITLKKKHYAKIKAIPAEKRTFENTIAALVAGGDTISDYMGRLEILESTSPSKVIRKSIADMKARLGKRLVDLEYDQGIYKAIKAYTNKKEKLTGAEKLLTDDIEKEYDRMGFTLSLQKQTILKSYLKKLDTLGIAFDRNLNEYKDQILVTKEELDGLPETYISTLKKDKSGKYIITLAYPDVLPYLGGAHNEKKRKELAEKNSRKGGKKNLLIIGEMARIRSKVAHILGYKTHADLVTELRMAKSAKNVRAFLEDIEKKTRIAGEKDRKMLLAYKKKLTKNPHATLASYDIGYLFKLLKKERFNIDSDYIKEHFPFEHVKQVTLDAYQELLNVKFKRRNDIPLWHKDAQFYDVYDASGEYLSAFALDLYPREGKYGHAAMYDVIRGREENGTYVAPFAAMVTNFTKPSKANPSLLSYREVETFFHEFGHVMHGVLTKAKYRAQSGTSVAQDFVEAPSQMLENWVWDPVMMKRLSKHYKTGKPFSPALIKTLIKSRSFGEAWSVRGQVLLALLDQELHTKALKNPNLLYDKLGKKLTGVGAPKGQMFLAGFGHLAHGYDAGYYGYLWSRVYAEDMFTRFEKAGVLNPRVGKEYRSWILEKGSSMEEMDLVKGFLKRAPNNKAFLKSIGI